MGRVALISFPKLQPGFVPFMKSGQSLGNRYDRYSTPTSHFLKPSTPEQQADATNNMTHHREMLSQDPP
jgi:hypothetical protein